MLQESRKVKIYFSAKGEDTSKKKKFKESAKQINLILSGQRFVLNILLATTMPCKNIGTNDKFCRKVALLRYTERLKFMFQSWNSASKQKPHRRLGTRLPSS